VVPRAGQGGEIVMIVRDRARGEHARSQVAEAAAGESPVLLTADLSVQADVRRVAHQVRDRYGQVDILVNNAGAAFSRREQSADGLELTWATNHLAPFLLTELMLPLLVAAPAGRIVNVVSEFYGRKLDLGNLQGSGSTATSAPTGPPSSGRSCSPPSSRAASKARA
jgi:NAD(P)-dependent dehydrogenase (short-subunit alcohol dehydrogenase family)